jgi:DedD protein
MVFDSEPRPPAPPVSVRIPGEDDSGFLSKVTPRGEPVPKTPAKRAPPPESAKAIVPSPQPAVEKPQPVAEKPQPVATTGAPPALIERQRAEGALADAGFVIGLGAYANEKNVSALMSKLKSEKIPAYAEPLETAKGPRTRVRAGPFQTEDAAEKARARLLRIGVQAGPVTPGPG